MKALYVALLTFLVSLSAVAEQYGAAVSDGRALSLEQAIAILDGSESAQVLVEGQVNSVCQAKGCWLALTGDAGDVRVTFKDYGFFVPFNLVGKTVRVEGELSRKQLSLAETKHYVGDAGGDPSEVTEPAVEYTMVATGVEVKG